ncbi:MAG: DUF4364 family protein [Oscillospiraceae bacterium]|jgi:hypothetical protein|nr:DUF4364 family protein [Oscillospiraceae bacterium]
MERQLLILLALSRLNALTIGQLKRFLFDNGIASAYDPLPAIAALKEAGLVRQTLGPQGLQLALNEKGARYLSAHQGELSEQTIAAADAKSAAYADAFRKEQDFLAQYSEKSSGNVPVSLSIRDGGNIVMKVSIIVRDTATAKKICDNWIKNSSDAYGGFWQAIAEGEPEPGFWSQRLSERGRRSI